MLLNLKEKKEANKLARETAVATREDQYDSFVDNTNNLTEAVRGIDEALELIDEME